MEYTVIKYFVDLHDNNYAYNPGDAFPRIGVVVSDERIAELAGSNNRQGVPLIQLVSEEVTEEAPEEVTEEAPKKQRKKKAAEE